MQSSPTLWRRLRASSGLLAVVIPAYLVTVPFLAFVFQDALPLGFAWPWAGVSILIGVGWLALGHWYRKPAVSGVLLTYQLASATFALLLSLGYSTFAFLAFASAPTTGQVVLAAFSAAMATVGAIVLAPAPLAAGAWIVGLGTGTVGILLTDGRWAGPGGWILTIALGLVLILLIFAYQRLLKTRMKAEDQAQTQGQLVNLLLHDFGDGTADWIWETDATGRLRSVSEPFAAQLDRTPAELEGRDLTSVLIAADGELTVEEEEDITLLRTLLGRNELFHDIEVPVQVRGHYRRWKVAGLPYFDETGARSGWKGVGSDVTEVRRLNDLNARLALLDNLTGLANRNRLQAVLHDHLSPRAEGRPCGLILIDLQNFRMVNEGLGHEVGDKLLREVALRLRSRVPASSLLARLGGDEFALVAPGAGEEALEGMVSALRNAGDEPYLIEGNRLEVTFQMGVAASPRDASGAAELLKCAELALHEAKTSHLGTTVEYQASFGEKARERIRLQGELKTAILEDQFELHYQPQIRVRDGALVGCEALVRWRHPERGMVSPAVFIPALEETGLILPAGLWILEAACREALSWPADQRVAVNVSAVQFASRSFLESVEHVLQTTGFPPARLELEITESVMAQDQKHVVQILEALRALGISISLDDFGTGYSSLSYLRTLPLDKLKVDQSFVRVMGQDAKAASIVRTVLELSRLLGLKTTAEGVETEDQRAQLEAMDCDSIQGYFYSKPLPPAQLKEFREKRP